MEKILFLVPKGIKVGQPSFERIETFKEYYKKSGYCINEINVPNTAAEKLKLFVLIFKCRYKYVFISMPPFSNWWLFFLPLIKIVLDVRDGWSIAMDTGYGGLARPNKSKAFIGRLIERLALKRAYKRITCTPGLVNYLQDLSNVNLTYIPNGISYADYELVSKIKKKVVHNSDTERNDFVLCCAGQFAEYGKDKVTNILDKLHLEANVSKCSVVIQLIGSSVNSNGWIEGYLLTKGYYNITVHILPRMEKLQMYELILKADMCLTIVRDPSYEFGTKVFDYILCDKYIFNYFDSENNFLLEFKDVMSSSLTRNQLKDVNTTELRRDLIVNSKSREITL